MTISHRAQYLIVTATVAVAGTIQLVRGIRPLIVFIAAVTFLFIGNATVYLAGSRQRAIERRRKRDYYAGL